MSELEAKQVDETKEIPGQESQSQEEQSYDVFPELDGVMDTSANPDPFTEMLTQEETVGTVEPQSVESPEATEVAPVVGESAVAKDDQNQYQYWQSQADIRTKELTDVLGTFGVESVDELRTKYGDIEDLAPIARYIKTNPSVLDNVEASLSNGVNQSNPDGNSGASLQRPEKPTKPNGYDSIDAYSDPSTESFKYRESLEEFRDTMVDYSQQENDALKQQIQQDRVAHQQRENADKLKKQLVSQYEMPPEEVDHFVKYMSSPESLSLDNLVKVWNSKRQQQPEVQSQQPVATAPDPQAEAMLRQRDKLSIPQPVSVVPGSGETTDKSVEESVMDAMISDYKKQNPW